MSTLTSASTDAIVKAALEDNASFLEDASAAKAKAYITAALIWLSRKPTSMTRAGNSIALSHEHVYRTMQLAMTLANQAVPASGGVKHFTFNEGFR